MTTLARIFNPKRLESEDPNKPEMIPLLKKSAELRNQAFVQWYDGPGHYLVDGLEAALIGEIVKAIGHKRGTVEDCLSNLRLLDKIQRDIQFIDRIVGAFEEEKKRKEG